MNRFLSLALLLLGAMTARGQGDNAGVEPNQVIDRCLAKEWAKHALQPSQPMNDVEFLRRLTQTTLGQLPTADEVRSFVADQRPDKRSHMINQLLEHPLHAALWASRLSDWTGNSLESLAAPDEETKLALSQMWHEWLCVRIQANMPYDQLVRAILTARSRHDESLDDWIASETQRTLALRLGQTTSMADRPTLDLFWRRASIQERYPARELAERVASSFLGVRLNCAQCHDHPFDRWKQSDYLGFVRIFEQVRHDMSPELRGEIAKRLDERRQRAARSEPVGPAMPRLTEVYLTALARSPESPDPKLLGGPILDHVQKDLREPLVDWMVNPAHETFASNFVNRVWAHYFGEGLVEPWDALTISPASYRTETLQTLSQQFIASKFDMRQLESLILNSQAWQLSSVPNQTNRGEDHRFSRGQVRLPPAAVVIDMWHCATGVQPDFGNARLQGLRAVQVGPDQLKGNRWETIFTLFGQSKRTETCDCGPRGRPSLRQALSLLCEPELLKDMSRGRLGSLLSSEEDNDRVLDELFLHTLSRWPLEKEREVAFQMLEQHARAQAFEHILAGLLSTQEYLTIH